MGMKIRQSLETAIYVKAMKISLTRSVDYNKGKLIKNKGFFKFNIGEEEKILDVATLCKACQDLSKSKTGLIFFFFKLSK